MSHPSWIPPVLNVHSARLTGKYAGENRAGTGWDRVRNCSYGRFLHSGILMGIALPIPSHRAKSHDFAHWWPAAAGHSRSADALPGKLNS